MCRWCRLRTSGRNDLTRPRVGVAANSTNAANYAGLTGANAIVNVNDSGVDATHPDLTGRVLALRRGLIRWDTALTWRGSLRVMAANQSRWSATFLVPLHQQSQGNSAAWPAAQEFLLPSSTIYSDLDLQEAAARTNALISNNSWNYGDTAYDIAAANFDAAVRDSLPGRIGSQPVMYVFSAGNDGGGADNGLGGSPQSVLSPATAKNVITVGAIEQFRNITDDVVIRGETNKVWLGMTDSADEVAAFSARGNVGIGVEGDTGRFKPDVVAPGGLWFLPVRRAEYNDYYSPMSSIITTLVDQTVPTNTLQRDVIFVPDNATQLIIRVENTRPHVDNMRII